MEDYITDWTIFCRGSALQESPQFALQIVGFSRVEGGGFIETAVPEPNVACTVGTTLLLLIALGHYRARQFSKRVNERRAVDYL